MKKNTDRISRQRNREKRRHTGDLLTIRNENVQLKKQHQRKMKSDRIREYIENVYGIIPEKGLNLRELTELRNTLDNNRNSLVSLGVIPEPEDNQTENFLENMEKTEKYAMTEANSLESLGFLPNCNENLKEVRKEKLRVHHEDRNKNYKLF